MDSWRDPDLFHTDCWICEDTAWGKWELHKAWGKRGARSLGVYATKEEARQALQA